MIYPVNIVPWLMLPLASAVPEADTTERTIFLMPHVSVPSGLPTRPTTFVPSPAYNAKLPSVFEVLLS